MSKEEFIDAYLEDRVDVDFGEVLKYEQK